MFGLHPPSRRSTAHRSDRNAQRFLASCATLLLSLLTPFSATVLAQSAAECRSLYETGHYAECLTVCHAATQARRYGEDWPLLKSRCERQLGLYEQAMRSAEAGAERYTWSIRLLYEVAECAEILGQTELAAQQYAQIETLYAGSRWRYTDADDLVALGNASLKIGADPRDVLAGYFDRARRNYPDRRDGYAASIRLALEKQDLSFAAELIEPALEKFPEDAELLYLGSQVCRSSDPARSTALINQALTINGRLTEALLDAADQAIFAERYDEVEEILEQILTYNPKHPGALSYLAVMAALQNQDKAFEAWRAEALLVNAQNADVDYVIGRELSARYRFKEAAEALESALAMKPGHTRARTEYAQTLLRLGREDEGWAAAEAAHDQDGYNLALYNLLKLHDTLDGFSELQTPHFQIRMERREALVYGPLVAELLEEAWKILSERYEYTPAVPVRVEIYHRPDDFAVRTFGAPDVSGFLGVCFGRVVTANSPASQRGRKTSWRSVLWHEFCHVITLQKTSNRIPRWLSEGISVYEEFRADSRWGQKLTPVWRERILNGQVTPVSRLSSVFLNAENPDDVQFAYFQSGRVVEFLEQTYGHEIVLAILQDLNRGLMINDCLERHAAPTAVLDHQFGEYLHEEALEWCPTVSFRDPAEEDSPNPDPPRSLNYHQRLQVAEVLADEEKFESAEAALLALIEACPGDVNPSGPRPQLAAMYRRLERFSDERKVLREHASVTADDLPALLRLVELADAAEDDRDLQQISEDILALDPFRSDLVRQLADSAVRTDDQPLRIRCLKSLLALTPDDFARLHYEIADLQSSVDPVEARRHILLSLDAAPRFREAHRLLLRLQKDTEK